MQTTQVCICTSCPTSVSVSAHDSSPPTPPPPTPPASPGHPLALGTQSGLPSWGQLSDNVDAAMATNMNVQLSAEEESAMWRRTSLGALKLLDARGAEERKPKDFW